jgi:hypothetical protein
MLPLIFLTQGCKTTEAPKPPDVILFQPIINAKVCENGVCSLISRCNEYHLDKKQNKWILFVKHPIEKCNATFGIDVDTFNKIREYSRELTTYIENNCGTKSN